MQRFKAIAAMSLNRVIGNDNKIPWHLPEDFQWFKQMTTGNVLVMGRKTYEAIGKALPNRTTIVLSRSGKTLPGARTVASIEEIDLTDPELSGREIFICGGAQIYEHALPMCSDLYLTAVKQVVQGDTFFPPFEDNFFLAATILDRPEFKILHYKNVN